jgi:predicted enzyme related to lactoylglutathione lyase
MSDNSRVGKIDWIDMTVDDAGGIRDFYRTVVRWGSNAELSSGSTAALYQP